MSQTPHEQDRRIEIRPLTEADFDAVVRIQVECFPGILPWSREAFRQQLRVFPEGQIGIIVDGELAATSSALLVTGEDWEKDHSFGEVIDGGSLKGHEPDGDTLYGIDLAVLPQFRGWRLARRIYEYRKELVRQWNLRRMVVAGRIPGLANHPDLSPDEYVRRVVSKELIDSTLTAQLANGFYIQRIIRGYLPSDHESRGNAVLLEWLNPDWHPYDATSRQEVRVATVQYEMRAISSWEEFESQCAYYTDLASDYRADFVVFPELLTNQLITLVPMDRPALRVRSLNQFTPRYVDMFQQLAMKHNINIIGGTHLVVEDDTLYNVAYLFHRNGQVDRQYKLHITPSESRWWGVAAGDRIEVFDTDCGRIAIMICYDVEFPELARIARARGANVFFVPYNTDLRSGHMRVRTCAAARCVENNVYVVLSGMCGGLPGVEWAEMHYARSAILTPSDIPFPRDGIAAEANDNGGTMVLHDLDYALLRRMQRQGSVRTWIDRRTDLYRVAWSDNGNEPGEV